ncbi:MAG: DivIVA domain-containing protein [Jatrophihabitantaceae bacterium]
MLTLLLYGLLAIVVVVALFLLAAHFLPAGEQIAAPVRDEAPWDLPDSRRMGPADVAAVRLPVALRGYRFAETDLLLDHLTEELRERDEEIAWLRGHTAPGDRGADPDGRISRGTDPAARAPSGTSGTGTPAASGSPSGSAAAADAPAAAPADADAGADER